MSARPWRVEVRDKHGRFHFDCCCASREKAVETAKIESAFWGYGWRVVNRDTAEVIHP